MRTVTFFMLIIMISACSLENKNDDSSPVLSLKKETFNVETGFNPDNAILNGNHLILCGNDSLNDYKLAAIDLNLNQIDSLYSRDIYNADISVLINKNDTLIARFESERIWKYWDDDWCNYDSENEYFIVDKAGFDLIMHLYEDSTYLVFGCDHGEFGGTVNFYNKRTDELFVTELYGANFCTNIDGKYLANGSLAHGIGSIDIIEVDNPEKLHLFPDSLNIYKNDSAFDYFRHLESCDYSLLPDSLIEKIKINSNFDYNSYVLYRKLIREKQNITTIIDSTGLLCFSTFELNNQLVHFMNDTVLFVGIMHDDSLYKVDKLYDEDFFTYFYSSQVCNETVLMAFSYWQRNSKEEKMICLVCTDEKLKRFNIY